MHIDSPSDLSGNRNSLPCTTGGIVVVIRYDEILVSSRHQDAIRPFDLATRRDGPFRRLSMR